MARVRILHVVNNLNYGGLERIVGDLGRCTDHAQFDVHIMALGYLGHFAQGVEAFATCHIATPMSPLSLLQPRSLTKDLRRIAPDVVHVHSGVWFKTTRAARAAGVPRVILTDHGRSTPDPLMNRALDSLASRGADVVVAVSDRLALQLEPIVHDPDRIRVIRNGVDTSMYQPRSDDQALRGELNIATDQPILGSIGRLEHIKGYDVMIDAFAHLIREWREGPLPVLVLAGDGTARAALEASALAQGVHEHVRFLGWRTDVESMHRAFTLFTMASRSEGTSVSLLEAMSAGLCPVVTHVGGNPVVLGGALRHRLVPSLNPQALALAWQDGLLNVIRREADCRAARERVIKEFSLDGMVRQYEALYVGDIAA